MLISSGLITVYPASVAGTVSADQVICSGQSPSNITLTGYTGTIQWQVSTDNSTFSNTFNLSSSGVQLTDSVLNLKNT